MYNKGDLKYGKTVTDTRTDNYDDGRWAYLPHSCNELVIGSKKEIEFLIADLERLLKTLE